MYYVITSKEKEEYNKFGIMSSRLETFWQDFLQKLPNDLSSEAIEKGFKLHEHESLKSTATKFSDNLIFLIPSASGELKSYAEELENIVICMHDPI